MHRPVMDTMYLDVGEAETPAVRPMWQKLMPAWRAARRIAKILAASAAGVRRGAGLVDNASLWPAILRGLGYRLACLPPLIALTVAILIYLGTHPTPSRPQTGQPLTPASFYENVAFTARDGTPLTAWLVPGIDAGRVLREREQAFKGKFPAVVLVHDFGQTRSQLLPLIAPLHDEGYTVLALGLRGEGTPEPAGQTFGLNEAGDLRASLAFLRDRPFVNPQQIAVVGVGTGASAALLAAKSGEQIASLVLLHPPERGRDVLNAHLVPTHFALAWTQPLCRWGFQAAYRVAIDDIDLHRFHAITTASSSLLLSNAGLDSKNVGQIRAFLAGQSHR